MLSLLDAAAADDVLSKGYWGGQRLQEARGAHDPHLITIIRRRTEAAPALVKTQRTLALCQVSPDKLQGLQIVAASSTSHPQYN